MTALAVRGYRGEFEGLGMNVRGVDQTLHVPKLAVEICARNDLLFHTSDLASTYEAKGAPRVSLDQPFSASAPSRRRNTVAKEVAL